MPKICIITGAAGGLGRQVTQKFLAEGYQVVATLAPHESLAVAERLSSQVVDVTDEAACAQLVADTVEQHGQVAVAVMLVGGFAMGGVIETDGSLVAKMMKLNFESAYFMARPLFAQMAQQPTGGHLIFVGAKPALSPGVGKNMLAYSLSKSLIFRLAEHLNEAGKACQVRASVIVPSTIDTPANRVAMPEANFADWVSGEDIADLMAFVCSPMGGSLRETVLKMYGNA